MLCLGSRLLCPVKGTHNTPEIRVALKGHQFLSLVLSCLVLFCRHNQCFFRSLVFTLLTLQSSIFFFSCNLYSLIIFSGEIYFTVKTFPMTMKNCTLNGTYYQKVWKHLFSPGNKAVCSLCRCYARDSRGTEKLWNQQRSGCPLHIPAALRARDESKHTRQSSRKSLVPGTHDLILGMTCVVQES